MKRFVCAGVVCIVTVLTLGAPASAKEHAPPKKVTSFLKVCSKAANGHKKVSQSAISACQAVVGTIPHLCPSGVDLLIVNGFKGYHLLRRGHDPVKVNKFDLFADIAHLCGSSVKVATATPTTRATSKASGATDAPKFPIGSIPPSSVAIVATSTVPG